MESWDIITCRNYVLKQAWRSQLSQCLVWAYARALSDYVSAGSLTYLLLDKWVFLYSGLPVAEGEIYALDEGLIQRCLTV